MSVTEAQKQTIQAQKEIIAQQLQLAKQQLDSINWGNIRTELNAANVDEAIIAYFDLGQQAVEGATDIVNSVLQSVGAFLDSIFEADS